MGFLFAFGFPENAHLFWAMISLYIISTLLAIVTIIVFLISFKIQEFIETDYKRLR